MTDVVSSLNPPPFPVNTPGELERWLKPYKAGEKGKAEAQKVVDWLDEALNKELNTSTSMKKPYLTWLIKLCKVYRLLPASYHIVDDRLTKLEDEPFDEEANLWAGTYAKPGQDPDEDPEFVSIKVLSRYSREGEREEVLKLLCREAVIWKRLSHPNILSFIGVSFSEELSIVYPWVENGNVPDYLKEHHEANPVKLLEDSAAGLRYLHNTGLAHGDIQPQHILVTEDGLACLGNIGHATINREKGDTRLGSVSVSVEAGNTRYRSPEFFTDEPGFKYQSDIYSMGMTIYEVLTAKKPFPGHNSTSVVNQITGGVRPDKPNNFLITRGYTEELWKLTTDCWQHDPARRPTADQLLRRLKSAARQWKSPFDLP